MKLGFYLQLIVVCLLFGLIVLGAGVRLADAGLSCPDWPLCHGSAVPEFDFRIFMEWIHRVIAMTSGVFALSSSIFIFSISKLRSRLGFLSILSLVLFGIQAFLGRQTVLELLKAETVTAHLVGGYLLLALNILILFRWPKVNSGIEKEKFKLVSSSSLLPMTLTILVFLQAILGALVSSHYAGHACPDFPLCQNQWIPSPFEGPLALHVSHRFGALVVLVASFFFLIFSTKSRPTHWHAKLGFVLIVIQWCLGVSMIFSRIHPGFSLFHSFFAVSIFANYWILTLRCSRKNGARV